MHIHSEKGHSYPIPNTQLTLHFTLLSPQTPLPVENTLKCLHKFAKDLSKDPPSNYLIGVHTETIQNVEAMMAPVQCPVCRLTNRDACRVLAGLWVYTSRQKLLYVQRYGVFEGGTGRMVAWGTLLTPRLGNEISVGDMDVDVDSRGLDLGLTETR